MMTRVDVPQINCDKKAALNKTLMKQGSIARDPPRRFVAGPVPGISLSCHA
jgi:hypothetical protein